MQEYFWCMSEAEGSLDRPRRRREAGESISVGGAPRTNGPRPEVHQLPVHMSDVKKDRVQELVERAATAAERLIDNELDSADWLKEEHRFLIMSRIVAWMFYKYFLSSIARAQGALRREGEGHE